MASAPEPSIILRRRASGILLLALLMAVTPSLTVWAQVLLGQILGNALTSSVLGLERTVAYLLLTTLGSVVVALIAARYSPRLTSNLITDLRTALHNQIAFANVPEPALASGDILSRISTDIPSYVQNSIALVTVWSSVVSTLVTIAVIGWTLNPLMTVVWLASTPIYYILPLAYRSRLRVLGERNRLAWGNATTSLVTASRGSDVLKTMRSLHERTSSGEAAWQEANRASVRELVTLGVVGWGQSALQNVMTLLMVIVGVLAVRQDAMNVGAAIAFVLLQQRLGAAVLALAQIPVARTYVRLSLQRLSPYFSAAPHRLPTANVRPKALVVRNLTISVPGSVLVSGCSFDLSYNEGLLITGPNGCGKTQLLRTLLGLRAAQRGTIEWDHDFAGHIGYVPQDVPIIDGTLRDNLSMGRDIDDDTLHSVLMRVDWAGVDLERDHTSIVAASGGELKKIAVVRAVLSQPKVMIVDELEAGVHDPEELIGFLLHEVPFVIAVTHRPDLWPSSMATYDLGEFTDTRRQ